ncbi:uncharacterized protein LOC132185582 [Corylus avellana]|uniref:uncharacterized protein LOC132185582 n=1 Tax=Corylus avellana TaxID=13451 RepID=UPI00286A84A1|nr:uncharacterized protein LOC132185582 [Corylus avellana]
MGGESEEIPEMLFGRTNVSSAGGEDFRDLQRYRDMFFVGLAKRLWFRRKDFVHEGNFTHPNALVQQVLLSRLEHTEANALVAGPLRVETIPRWEAPGRDMWKLNWDAALCSKRGLAGMGVVIRNSDGDVVAVRCMTKQGLTNPLVAEAWAGVQALIFGREMDLNHIVLEGDAKIVVDALLLTEPNWSKIGHQIADMKMLLDAFPSWSVRAVGRAVNNAAHVIARMAVKDNIERTWRGCYPKCIHDIIRKECSTPSFD